MLQVLWKSSLVTRVSLSRKKMAMSKNASEILIHYLVSAGLVKSLQATNAASWHEIFLGLWMAALRLVQRVRA